MYKLIFTFAFIGFLSLNTTSAQKEGRDNYEVKVDGLGCPFCAFGLEKKFKEFKGLKNVKIDMETGVFTFTLPSSTPLSISDIENQVDQAGYTPIRAQITRLDGSIEKSAPPEEVEVNHNMLVTKTFFAAGKCDMCRSRMRRAVNTTGAVTEFEWQRKKQMATVTYDKSKVTLNDLEKLIADVGHDTKSYRASDEAYEALHDCCHYKREKE